MTRDLRAAVDDAVELLHSAETRNQLHHESRAASTLATIAVGRLLAAAITVALDEREQRRWWQR